MKTHALKESRGHRHVFHVSAFLATVTIIAVAVGTATTLLLRYLGADALVLEHRATIWLSGVIIGLGISSWIFEQYEVRD